MNLYVSYIVFAQLDYNFANVGDCRCTSDTKKIVKSIENKNPEFIIKLGDFSYDSTADCWLDRIDPIDEKMKITIGTHDDIVQSLLKQ